jgi:hypothetical protein
MYKKKQQYATGTIRGEYHTNFSLHIMAKANCTFAKASVSLQIYNPLKYDVEFLNEICKWI